MFILSLNSHSGGVYPIVINLQRIWDKKLNFSYRCPSGTRVVPQDYLLEESCKENFLYKTIPAKQNFWFSVFFCIFLVSCDFSYHLNTTPAIKSAQATYFPASKAGRKEPLSRKVVCFCKSCFSPFSYFTLFSASSFSRFYISFEEERGSQGYF